MKNLSAYLIAALVFAAPLSSVAQNTRTLQPNERQTNVTGVTTIAAPPAGFDPISASDEDLAYHGFPPRPNETAAPKAYERWAKAMNASKIRISPTLQTTSIYHGPAKLAKNSATPPKENNSTYSSYSWSGYADFTGTSVYGASSYYYVYDDTIIPVAQQAFGVCNGGWDFGSAWVGMDGATGTGVREVLQAGSEFDAYCNGGVKSAYYSLWFEWYPYPEVRISGIPIAPGDNVFVEVWHTSPTQGYAYIVNESTNQSVSVGVTAYPGYPLIGNSAEWILEGVGAWGATTRLTNYVAEPFWSAYAVTESGLVTDPSSASSNTYLMLDGSGHTISYPTLLGPAAFLMQDAPSAR